MTNMPEVIRIARQGLEFICPAWSKDELATSYTRTDKHEELKAIAEKMYRALQLTKSDAEKNGFKYGRQSNCVKALTEYNKYKGE